MGYFIDFIHVYNTAFGFFHIIVSVLQQVEDDVFDVFPNVTGFRQGGSVGNGKGYIQKPGHGLGKQGLAGTGRADEQNIAFLNFHVIGLDG